ncbi:uncharacterized protein LOC141698600 isoform X2 [Apium graveolens]|uniref:uncharacterized protein LOC141698600 isoform X2 n=1 Tax=Apium graveolens TaxID=4045 RepID=UPI003D7B065A
MFHRFILWISHLWGLLCEFIMPSTPNTQTPITTTSQSPSSSPSDLMPSTTISQTPTPTSWGVFLSFRGVDTRNNFTSHLYDKLVCSGFPTFMDNPELRSGQVISEALFQAIQESKIYVIVFSENYASSAWCLDELVEILNCHKSMKRLVIPVFYYIDPSVVRYQTKKFTEAFEKHQTRSAQERVMKWRDTLVEVSGFSGYHVTRISLDMNPKTLDVVKYPVGLDSRVEEIMSLMSTDTLGVINIGIYGMGGIGKTTLAKALFNQLLLGGNFEGSCFLANVRDASTNYKGIESLQQKLINEVLKSNKTVEVHNVEEGAKLIRERICLAKVLVLVDDIYDRNQFESLVGPFASGSVVIITTRDEEMLDKIKAEPRYRYKVTELNDQESLSLFSKHAFENGGKDNTLMILSKDIISLAGGLPLALEVFGAYLSTQHSVVGWRSYIQKLQRDPDSTIQQKLKISLNAVELEDPLLKQIFLDIACFFIGNVKDEVVEIMDTCYLFADHNIDILKKRCLLTIRRNMYGPDRLEMHDLLRDVGRDIARNNSANDPGNYSRLWAVEDIYEVLENQTGTKAIECISYKDGRDELQEVAFTTKTFERMSKLRFLKLINANLTGSFEHIFKDLRWLRWEFCPLKCLPSEFYSQKLVILELPYSKMTTWEPNVVSRVFGKLKTLNMKRSLDLVTTPDFAKLPSLETLNLDGCERLEELHMSIGSLVRLESLNLAGCKKLRSLPDTICNLRVLKVLNISECYSLEALPLQLGNIKSLTNFIAYGLTLSKLPDSIGHLTKLVELNLLDNQKLETLPDTICNLRSLEILDIYGCGSLSALPTEIGNIESLKKIDVRGLPVSKFPDSIGNLTKLVELDLWGNEKLETLPDTICNLRNLEILSIYGCEILETLPDDLWTITRLKKLDASYATMLKKLPDIESSQIALSLQELDMSMCRITALPSGFSQLSNLQSLELFSCCHLFSIPKLPPNLKCIKADSCNSLERLPNISDLKHLETLNLSWCSGLTEIQDLEELTAIRNLALDNCSGLTYNHLTKRLFKVYSEFGHQITVKVDEVLDHKGRQRWVGWIDESLYWTSASSDSESTVYAYLLPNESHNFMGIILCFNDPGYFRSSTFGFSVKNTRSGFIWRSGSLDIRRKSEVMVIVPKSIFPVRDDDHRIEFTADNTKFVGIHLLYNTETEMIEDVMKKHVIDIDALKLVDPVLQDMFLDITCFFIGWEKNKVVQVLETCYTNVDHNIDILKNRCLLSVNSRNELKTDDLLQHLGKEIARKNSPDEPGKHSRLWLSIDIYDVLKKETGTEVTEGIVPRKVNYQNALYEESFTLETFKNMRKLRFLYLNKVHLTGSFEQKFEDLRWLCWECCPLKCLPSEFYPIKLVILELPSSNIITMWELNMVPHVFEKLKILDMSYSQDLATITDFTKLPCLETLNLTGCESLEEVHLSIGSLTRLVSLYLHGCVKLRSLPNTICNLTALEVLDICDCSCLEALPMPLGNIQSLRELNAGNLTVSILPDSIGNLSKLVMLRLNSNKNLKTLPVTICNLRSLEIIDISGCEKLEILPDQLWNLTRLRELKAELPCNLKWIMADCCTLMERFPNLSNLKQLEYIKLEDCGGLSEIQGLHGPTSVRELHLESSNSSLLECTFTESFFQMYSQFGHPIQICSTEFPDWISKSSEYESMSSFMSIEPNDGYPTMSLNLPPNVSHNYLGMILCIRSSKSLTSYSIEKTASNFIWRGEFESYGSYKSLMVIVPKSTFSVEDGDDRIILKANRRAKVYGIHLLYKTEEFDSTTVNESS